MDNGNTQDTEITYSTYFKKMTMENCIMNIALLATNKLIILYNCSEGHHIFLQMNCKGKKGTKNATTLYK